MTYLSLPSLRDDWHKRCLRKRTGDKKGQRAYEVILLLDVAQYGALAAFHISFPYAVMTWI